MFKKFNWGWGIAIVIIVFFLSIFYRIFLSYQHDINLVSKDYYPKGINHQQHIEKARNAKRLGVKPEITTEPDFITIIFPEELSKGNMSGLLHFYRPSDPGLDRKFDLQIDATSKQRIDGKEFQYGKYILKMEISVDGTDYYFEEDVFVGK